MNANNALQGLVMFLSLRLAVGSKSNWMDQSWFFDWTPSNARFPVPITAQCETLHVTWTRQTATGPDGMAPYYLHIYTSNFVTPFIIPAGSDPETYVTIPFAPGTEYEICMFDSRGNTGGCQAIYSVYPNTTTSNPTCKNFTTPEKALDVLSESDHGTLSAYGWVPSCTDIRLTPKEGSPPFIFTVAPALHPPLNITSNDKSSINWTVDLIWGLPFFISLSDSTGLTWTNGPIHAGKGDTACFSDIIPRPSSTGLIAGVGVAGLVVGAMISVFAAFVLKRRHKTRRYEGDEKPVPFYKPYLPNEEGIQLEERQSGYGASTSSPRYERLPSFTGTLNEFHVEPFIPPSRRAQSQTQTTDDGSAQAAPNSLIGSIDASTTSPPPVGRHEAGANQVYVIHHDSGGAPVSVVASQGTEVVELPPGYSPTFSPTSSIPRRSSASRRQGKSPTTPVRDAQGT